MPRPSLGKTRLMTSLPPDYVERLDKLGQARHATRADLIEEAVKDFLDREERRREKDKGRK